MFSKLFPFLLLLLFPCIGFCHNGKIACAYPVNSIKIDGDLKDWPAAFERYGIGTPTYRGDTIDYKAVFMIGYNLKEQCLYLAIEVDDNMNIIGASEGSIWGRKRDQHFLYLDPEHHSEHASGAVMLFGSQTGVDIWKPENNWDPYNKSFDRQNIILKTKRAGNKTSYEWRIFLGNAIAVNKSIGFDSELMDTDTNGKSASYAWGPGGLKNRIPSRLGDVLLLEEKKALHAVKGNIAWNKPLTDGLPAAVKIISVKNTLLWCQASVDSAGRYWVMLPEGSYYISPASKTTNPANYRYKTRINDVGCITIHVKTGDVVSDTLKIDWYTKPDYLISQQGLLFTYDESKQLIIDQFIEAYRQFHNIPGISIALIKDGKVIYNKTFGTKNTITNEPAILQTVFETASISKAVFAFAVNRLVEKGLIDLDKPLMNYLSFDNLSEDSRASLITARLVLSHQTGLPNWAFGGPFGWKSGSKTKLLFTPGTNYGYSGEGYEYLGRVVEKITGKPLEQVMQEEVYAVMGMHETSLTATEVLKSRIGIGHSSDLPLLWNLETTPWVAGSMYSTSADLAKYMCGLINSVGLSKENYRQMFTPQVENSNAFMRYFGGGKIFHTLGFEYQQSPYGNVIHHGGNNGDYQGRFAFIPEKRLGYVVLCNSDGGHFMDLDLQRFLITGRN